MSAQTELIQAAIEFVGPLDDPSVGWRGLFASHPDLFKCEACGQEHEDCTMIRHLDGCRVKRLLSAVHKYIMES